MNGSFRGEGHAAPSDPSSPDAEQCTAVLSDELGLGSCPHHAALPFVDIGH